jgi:hypothetical protein
MPTFRGPTFLRANSMSFNYPKNRLGEMDDPCFDYDTRTLLHTASPTAKTNASLNHKNKNGQGSCKGEFYATEYQQHVQLQCHRVACNPCRRMIIHFATVEQTRKSEVALSPPPEPSAKMLQLYLFFILINLKCPKYEIIFAQNLKRPERCRAGSPSPLLRLPLALDLKQSLLLMP